MQVATKSARAQGAGEEHNEHFALTLIRKDGRVENMSVVDGSTVREVFGENGRKAPAGVQAVGGATLDTSRPLKADDVVRPQDNPLIEFVSVAGGAPAPRR